MWKVISETVPNPVLPEELINTIKALIAQQAAAGLTEPHIFYPPIDLGNGLVQRIRTFTTQAAADEYANLLRQFEGYHQVISVEETT